MLRRRVLGSAEVADTLIEFRRSRATCWAIGAGVWTGSGAGEVGFIGMGPTVAFMDSDLRGFKKLAGLVDRLKSVLLIALEGDSMDGSTKDCRRRRRLMPKRLSDLEDEEDPISEPCEVLTGSPLNRGMFWTLSIKVRILLRRPEKDLDRDGCPII